MNINEFINEKLNPTTLPVEAVKILTDTAEYYLENEVEGYNTTYVQGRESLGAEIETYETGLRDGAVFKSRRFPVRTITVGFYIKAPTAEAFRASFNKLNEMLNVKEARFIFDDEPDKYFVGAPAFEAEIEGASNTVTGEWKIYCLDPFKYSVTEAEIAPVNGEFNFLYDGTYKAFPKLRAQFSGDCGYVGFVADNGAIIQAGNPEETDFGDVYEPSQTLVNDGASALAGWSVNSGKTVDSSAQVGTVKVDTVKNSAVMANSYGTGTGWHGVSISKLLPADSTGVAGAQNWTLTYKQRFAIASKKTAQLGSFQCLALDANNNVVAGVYLCKKATGTKVTAKVYADGGSKKSASKSCDYSGTLFGYGKNAKLTTQLTKSGSTLKFNIGGWSGSVTAPNIAEAVVTKIVFYFGKYGTKTALGTNALYNCKFVKNNCETYGDVPNKFTAGDVLEIDCGNAGITLTDTLDGSGIDRSDLGALGNDWETFVLEPGMNKIVTAYSEWATNRPTFSLAYRRRFL